MKPVTFYGTIPDMECLSGDTLPTFHIQVTGADLSDSSMELILASDKDSTAVVLRKPCEAEENGFYVQLSSTDTAYLPEGIYDMHFRLIIEDIEYKKLHGNLYIRTAAR